MKHTNYKYKEMKIMINITIFPFNIFLNKNTKKHPNISTYDQKHIDGYDTMYPCSEFEVILIRFPRRYFSK